MRVLCTLIGTNALFELCTVGGSLCILLCICRFWHICCFGFRYFCMVFSVLKAILVSVSLNILAICFVLCPKYVNVIHLFCLCVFSLVWCSFVTMLFLKGIIFWDMTPCSPSSFNLNSTLHNHRCENLKSYVIFVLGFVYLVLILL
jgi:hypothetical protein